MQEVRSDDRVKALQGVWVFERCTESELPRSLAWRTPQRSRHGRVLATEGTRVRSSSSWSRARLPRRAAVRRSAGRPWLVLRWLALLDGGPRTASVRALTADAGARAGRSRSTSWWIEPSRRSPGGCWPPWPDGAPALSRLCSERLHARRLSRPSRRLISPSSSGGGPSPPRSCTPCRASSARRAGPRPTAQAGWRAREVSPPFGHQDPEAGAAGGDVAGRVLAMCLSSAQRRWASMTVKRADRGGSWTSTSGNGPLTMWGTGA